MSDYKAQSAQDAQARNFGTKSYWDYLEQHSQQLYNHYMSKGNPERANEMLVRSLSEALRGNDGE
jgi:hypothetical protein